MSNEIKRVPIFYTEKMRRELIVSEPVLGASIKRIGRIERYIIPDVFACLVEAIVGQLISKTAADSIFIKMRKKLGAITPDNLASYSVEELQCAGLTQRKAEYILDAARAILAGSLNFDAIETMDNKIAIRELTKVRGIGQWTAEMLLMGPFGRMDIVSYQDAAILRAMTQIYEWDKPTPEKFQNIISKYSPYGTVASIYLWYLSYNTA